MASAMVAARPPPPDMDIDLDDDANAMDALMAQVDEKSVDRNDSSEPMVMLAFYRRLLPWKSLFGWLNHEPTPTRSFTHREFAFTLQNEAYLRYNSFANADELKREVCRMNPARFEIGPVYSAKPKDKRTVQKTAFRPVSRELVFDIDMTDYDEIRTCCSGKGICRRCWAFIAVAVRVLDEALREDFGFKHLLWVYSGRRGIHCWVSDKAARELSDDARRALVGYLEVIKGSANQVKKVDLGTSTLASQRSLHPSLRRALGSDKEDGSLHKAFIDTVLRDQDCFRSREHWETLLALLPDADVAAKLRTKWENDPSRRSFDKWADVTGATKSARSKVGWEAATQDIILQYTYPRIDAEVSKHMNHLLKSPFCIHPATGRVCVPIEPSRAHEFDPDKVPTVAQLLRELNSAEARAKENGSAEVGGKGDWEKTSLKPYVELLDRHVSGLMKETRDVKRAFEAHSMDF